MSIFLSIEVLKIECLCLTAQTIRRCQLVQPLLNMSAELSTGSQSTLSKVQLKPKSVISTRGTINPSNLQNTIMQPMTSLSMTDSPSQKKPLISSKPGDLPKSPVVAPKSVLVDDIYNTKFPKPFVCKIKSTDIDALTLILNDWRTEQFNYLQRKFTD